jgi:hypothetical protein
MYNFINPAQRRFFLITRIAIVVNVFILMIAVFIVLKVLL